MEDFNGCNIDCNYEYNYNHDYNSSICTIIDEKTATFATNAATCIIISVGLPLTLVAIYGLYSQVRTQFMTDEKIDDKFI